MFSFRLQRARLTLCALLFCLSLCHAADRPKYWPLVIGQKSYPRLELALTHQERQHGLMNRTDLPLDGGMIFVFKQEISLSFWMKNTRIPLDILYLDSHGTIMAIHTMNVEPPHRPGEPLQLYEMRLPGYPSPKPAQFAIELHAGQAEQAGVKVGDRIRLRQTRLLKLLP